MRQVAGDLMRTMNRRYCRTKGVLQLDSPHMEMMEQFNFDASAEVFISRRHRHGGRMTYLRFASASEAIRHAIERQSVDSLAGTIVEVEDMRIGPSEIRCLYESDEYRLPRHPAT